MVLILLVVCIFARTVPTRRADEAWRKATEKQAVTHEEGISGTERAYLATSNYRARSARFVSGRFNMRKSKRIRVGYLGP
jgi:hypothetical protein